MSINFDSLTKVIEGKTKVVYENPDDAKTVYMLFKDDITGCAGVDDAQGCCRDIDIRRAHTTNTAYCKEGRLPAGGHQGCLTCGVVPNGIAR